MLLLLLKSLCGSDADGDLAKGALSGEDGDAGRTKLLPNGTEDWDAVWAAGGERTMKRC